MILEAEYAILRDRMAANAKGLVTGPGETQKPISKPKPRMNKWEQAYAQQLEALKRYGDIRWYGFEVAKLRLADKTHYTPDFMVAWRSGVVEFHEVKGFWRDDARVKIKVAAELFPFAFIGVTRDRKTGEWKYEHFRGADRK